MNSFQDAWTGSASFADYDGDGDPDVLVTGWDAGPAALASGNAPQAGQARTTLYRNEGGQFRDSQAGLPGFGDAAAAWGDYNNDGTLDLLISGYDGVIGKHTYVYRNRNANNNQPPAAPDGLYAAASQDGVVLHWNAPLDDSTPSQSLTYHLRLGSLPAVDNLSPPLSCVDSEVCGGDGFRSVVQAGMTTNTAWNFSGLTPGVYYWSVQAIDSSYAGSAFGLRGAFMMANRDASEELSGTKLSVIDSLYGPEDMNWYKISIPEPDSTITVELNDLGYDYDLYLFAPKIDEQTGQLTDIGLMGNIGLLGNIGLMGNIGDLHDLGLLGNIGELMDMGLMGNIGDLSQVGLMGNIGLLGNISTLGDAGSLINVSAQPMTATEKLDYNVHELSGSYYLVVQSPDPASFGKIYTLEARVIPPEDPMELVNEPFSFEISEPISNTTIETLVLYNGQRVTQLYGANAATSLKSKLQTLAEQPAVNGLLVELDSYPEIQAAYQKWDQHPDQPQFANNVAQYIKGLINQLAPAYPNLKYMVIAGSDQVIPFRRVRDEAFMANERTYLDEATTDAFASTFQRRYFLSDDYYGSLLPIPWRGRELYIPQLGVGRLVEQPAEITAFIDRFIASPTIAPQDGLVTGYDFLKDQAGSIKATLQDQGITPITTLINDAWTADDLRMDLFGPAQGSDLVSLNAHFSHYAMQPAVISDTASLVDVGELKASTTDYQNSLVFSVGCHSGLNVPDGGEGLPLNGLDWVQAFTQKKATFIGNTGYGYGDSELIAYSERLMVYFIEELSVQDGASVGEAMMRAKQRYFNTTASGSFSGYDEKSMGIMTVYGLPMLKVDWPAALRLARPDLEPTLSRGAARPAGPGMVAGVTATPYALDFDFVKHDLAGLGSYYTVKGTYEAHVPGWRPVQPRASYAAHEPGMVAHGALMLGGSFSDSYIDPVISQVISQSATTREGTAPLGMWFPNSMGLVNRFALPDGSISEQLVVVPGQYLGVNGQPARGLQRLYNEMQFEVYYAPEGVTDFTAPSIWQVEVLTSTRQSTFRVLSEDNAGLVQRIVVLYRERGTNSWTPVDLVFDWSTGWASASVELSTTEIEFFVQALDASGNIALALDHGNPFHTYEETYTIRGHLNYLPVMSKQNPPAPASQPPQGSWLILPLLAPLFAKERRLQQMNR